MILLARRLRYQCTVILLLTVILCFLKVQGSVTSSSNESSCDEDNSDCFLQKQPFLRPRRQFQSVSNAIGSVNNLHSSSLSEHAIRLCGNSSPFSRLLEEEERQQRLMERESQQSKSTPIHKMSPILYGGLIAVSLFSIRLGGSSHIFQEMIQKSIHILAIAWMPSLILHASWIEALSFVVLLAQPSVRSFLIKEYLPETWSTLRKMMIAEVWRRFWAAILTPLPKPFFTPQKYHLLPMPRWFQKGWLRVGEVIDKYTQSLFRKSVEQSFYDSIGIVYESMANSMLEISILYEEASTNDSNSVGSSMQYTEIKLMKESDSSVEESDDTCDIQI